MQIVRIKDNTGVSKEHFDRVAQLTGKILDKTLGQLQQEGIFVFPHSLQDASDLSDEQFVLQTINSYYHSSNVMGIIGHGNQRLDITSRFSSGEEDYLFKYLLHKVLDMPNLVDLKLGSDHTDKLFDLLIFLFPLYLRSAMRKGIYKKYITKKYNDQNIQGVIDFPRHIKSNTPFVGKVAFSRREFSVDNELTQLVRHTIDFIKQKPAGNLILRRVKDEVSQIAAATPTYRRESRSKVINDNKKNPVQHSYYQEYAALQRLCLLILQHEKRHAGFGLRQVYGILFDGAWLWEEYLNSLLGPWFYHPQNKDAVGGQTLFAGGVGKIYPDFISRQSAVRVIADAKYKPSINIGRHDYQQVLAYMYRFDAKRGLYLYPEAGGGDARVLRLNQGTTFEQNVAPREAITVTKLGFAIPSTASDYAEFVALMQLNEADFMARVQAVLAGN